MTSADRQHEDLCALFDDLCDGSLSESDAVLLDDLLRDDPAARWEYLCYMDVHAGLGLARVKGKGQEARDEKVASGQWSVASEEGSENANLKSEIINLKSEIPNPTPIIIIDTSSALASIPSPFYIAHPYLFANLFSLLFMGLAILGAWMYQIDIPRPIAENDQPAASVSKSHEAEKIEYVGRITGMVDCRWEEGSEAANHKSEIINHKFFVALGDKFTLASGLMEITYDTGAKVILQGPVTYEVESVAGGFLSIGKLTARLEKKAEGGRPGTAAQQWSAEETADQPSTLRPSPSAFSVRTPTATVTDLGTEFGVEVSEDRRNHLHVFQGKVVLETRGPTAAKPRKIELIAGESASVEPQGDVIRHSEGQTVATASSAIFVRTLAAHPIPRPLIAYWPMNEGRGRTAYDQSGNHIDGWLNGEATWAKGKFGGAVRLPGSGYVYCKWSPKLVLGEGDFTASLWFKGKVTADWRWLLDYNGRSGDGDQGAMLIVIHGGRLRVSLGEWFTDVVLNPTTVFNRTDWYHIVVVREKTLVKAYVNGQPEGMPVSSSVELTGGNLRLGQGPEEGPEGATVFNGDLDDVALWNVALTPAQVKALANGLATPLDVLSLDPSRLDTSIPAISWGEAKNISGVTDVDTTGTLVAAYNFGGAATTVNDVTFAAATATTTLPSGISAVSGLTQSGSATFGTPKVTDSSYQTLLQSGWWNGDSDPTTGSVTLSNLTVGQTYEIEVWVNDSRGWASPRIETISGSPTLAYNTNGVGQYIIGTFTAEAARQTLTFTANVGAQINALQLRGVSRNVNDKAGSSGDDGNRKTIEKGGGP